jgi:hypothetical protein
MDDSLQVQPAQSDVVTRPSLAAVLMDVLASVKFAVAIIIVISVACVFGTVIPQGGAAASYAQQNPAAADRMELFARLGLIDVYSSWWFIGLLCLLAATVMTCSLRRFATVKRTSGAAQRRALGSMFTHISILLILAGGVVRGVWGEKGHIEFHEGETRSTFGAGNAERPLPFAVHLEKFEIETYAGGIIDKAAPGNDARFLVIQWPERQLSARIAAEVNTTRSLSPEGEEATPENTFHITVLKYVPDFAMDSATRDVVSRSDEPRNPALLLAVNGPDYENHRWVFARFPDFAMSEGGGHASKPGPLRYFFEHDGVAGGASKIQGRIKSFRSTVNVVENGQVSQTRTIEVNRPFKRNGYTFYQTGYHPDDLSWTSLEVVRDPGVPMVYAGFGFMIVGLFIVFYLNPWLASRKAKA